MFGKCCLRFGSVPPINPIEISLLPWSQARIKSNPLSPSSFLSLSLSLSLSLYIINIANFSLSSLSLTPIHSHHVVPNTLPKVVDLYPLYPVSVRPAFMTELRSWYIATYKDRFFTDRQPAWFWLLTIMEAGGHVPITVTSIAPLWKAQRTLNSPFFVHGCLLEFWCVDHDWSLVYMLLCFAAKRDGVRYLNLDRVPGFVYSDAFQSTAFKILLLLYFLSVSPISRTTIPAMRFLPYFVHIYRYYPSSPPVLQTFHVILDPLLMEYNRKSNVPPPPPALRLPNSPHDGYLCPRIQLLARALRRGKVEPWRIIHPLLCFR